MKSALALSVALSMFCSGALGQSGEVAAPGRNGGPPLATPDAAPMLGYYTDAMTMFNHGNDSTPAADSMHGWQFVPAENIVVTHLGVWDRDDDGMDIEHRIGIWRTSDQLLIADATLPAGTGSELSNHYRWVRASGRLTAGTNYTIGYYSAVSNTDGIVVDAFGEDIFDPLITHVGDGRFEANSGGFRMPTQSTTFDRYGPNFRFKRPDCTSADFDELTGSGIVPAGTGGVADWGAWRFYETPQSPYTAKSPAQRVYVPQGQSSRFSFGRPVIVQGAWFSGPSGHAPIRFRLYRNGGLVHTSASVTTDGSGIPQYRSTGYNGEVDAVEFDGDLGFFVMDNLVYCEACTVVSFDNLAGSGTVSNGYGGVATWTNWRHYESQQDPYTPKSPAQRAYATTGTTGSLHFGRDVRVEGAWFSGATGTEVTMRLKRAGVVVATTATLNMNGDGVPRWIDAGYEFRVDEIEFVSPLNNWTMDDLTYCEVDHFDLSITGTCPGRITVTWSNARPNVTLALVFARNLGNFQIPFGPCQGTYLGLGNQNIQLISTFSSGTGNRSVSGNTQACGDYLQMHDIPACDTSNYATIP